MTTPARRTPLDPVAVALVVIATVISIRLVGPLVRADELPVMIAAAVLLLGLRVYLLFRPADLRARRVVAIVGLALSALLVYISPVYGGYAFLGYMENPPNFRGWARPAMLVGTAAVTAAAQMGGPRGYFASWPLYALMITLNLGIVALITLFERQRERSVTELERTVAELRDAQARNAELSDQLLTQAREAGVLDERARLSREIHDTVAQGLVGIITQLEAAEPGSPDLADRLDRARASARDALGEARQAVRALASPRLDEASLPDALEVLVEQVGRHAGLDARFALDGTPTPTPADAELLRVAQEGLSNVSRHACADRVVVTLGYDPEQVRLDIRDDGQGFDVAATTPGHGLTGMRQRLARLGGCLTIESTEGEGCTISAAIPR